MSISAGLSSSFVICVETVDLYTVAYDRFLIYTPCSLGGTLQSVRMFLFTCSSFSPLSIKYKMFSMLSLSIVYKNLPTGILLYNGFVSGGNNTFSTSNTFGIPKGLL